MGEIRLSHCCRLCLKEGFSLTNIFSQRSAAGDPLYQILNFIYEMKIFENDGLPSQICSPCMWRMIEFDACKKNVRSAEAEIMRLLSQRRPYDPSEVEVAREQRPVNTEVSIKEEMDIVEWDMPAETAIKVPEAAQQFQEADKDDYNDVESDDVEPFELPEEEYEEKSNEQVFYQPLKECTGLTDLKNIISMKASKEAVAFEGESSSICTSPSDSTHSALINEEIEIVEWQMPQEMKIEPMDIGAYRFESLLHNDPNIITTDRASVSSKMILQGMDLELKKDENEVTIDKRDAVQSTGSSDLKNFINLEALKQTVGNSFEGERSSIFSTQGISKKNRDANKETPKNDLRDDVVPVEELLSAEFSKSILDVTKSDESHIKGPLPVRKRMFICDICKKTFKRKGHLGCHVRIHYDERLFSCTICDKRFKQENVRYQHELVHHKDEMSLGKSGKGINKKQYTCDLCAKNFSSRSGLYLHSNMHSSKYKCSSCGRHFGDIADLRRHTRTHTKEKPFRCEVCSKCFSQKSTLNRHLLIHSSERPHICDICDKRFKSKREKSHHALLHLRKK